VEILKWSHEAVHRRLCIVSSLNQSNLNQSKKKRVSNHILFVQSQKIEFKVKLPLKRGYGGKAPYPSSLACYSLFTTNFELPWQVLMYVGHQQYETCSTSLKNSCCLNFSVENDKCMDNLGS
jgi:hypothetical protein